MARITDYVISAAIIAAVVWIVFTIYGKVRGGNE
jgi:hypothetical protein